MKRFSHLLGFLLFAVWAFADNAPKYIFYFIGDGMGHGQVMAAETYLRLVEKSDTPLLMTTFPVASVCTTYSASTPVTDSAAAGTALATGAKTDNNKLGVDPDKKPLRSVALDLDELGYGIGLVTNVCPDDATPAAFYANVPARQMFYEIGVQAAESPVDFLAGSTLRGVMKKGKYTGLYEKFAENGMEVVRGVENLPGIDARRILLLNTDTVSQNMGFTIDNPTGNNLSQFTQAAIDHLSRISPDKFFLMVEGGNIDWAGHDNDAATIVREVIAYQNPLQIAYQFYLRHPDETLIIVTADHETGGMTVGSKSVGYNNYPEMVDRQHLSKKAFTRECKELLASGRNISWQEMKHILSERLGFFSESQLSESQEKQLEEAFNETFITRTDREIITLYNSAPIFVEVAYNIQNDLSGYGFTSPKHTGNPVPVYAVGCGAENFGRPLDNTDIPEIIRELTK